MEPLNFLDTLREEYPVLTGVFERHWHTPLHQYAPDLYRQPPRQIEVELETALAEEWETTAGEPDLIGAALSQLRNNPVLQTAHHLTPTHGPTFFAIDLISLAGLPAGDVYLVAANSGVPFSNSAWSGALSYGSVELAQLIRPQTPTYTKLTKAAAERKEHGEGQHRITLIPSKDRDRLVFGYRWPEKGPIPYTAFSDRLQEIVPPPRANERYSDWAVRCATGIQQRVLPGCRIQIFDINRVARRYLIKILEQSTDHPCCRLLSDHPKSATILSAFDHPALFLGNHPGKKSAKVDPLIWTGSGLKGRKSGEIKTSPAELKRLLERDQICPAVFLLFFILRQINGIKCLGSFNQLEYLEQYRQRWQQLTIDWPLYLQAESGHTLTTGRLVEQGGELWPLDLAFNGRTFRVADFADRPMKTFWSPIAEQLTKNVTRRP